MADSPDLDPTIELPSAGLPGGDTPSGESAAGSVLHRLAGLVGRKPNLRLPGENALDHPEERSADGVDPAGRAGKYAIHGELGRGGVGAVHLGHDQDLGRDVAIKFLQPQFRENADVVHRFVEEAQIGGQLQHPGVVPIYDLGLTDGRPYFAMKLVKGRTLGELLAGRESPESERMRFLSIFEQVCQTMAYAHARGVVHRDLKPANIMIGAFGEVQVVDWGLGKVLDSGRDEERGDPGRAADARLVATVRSTDDTTQSITGTIMGTPAYMPPEQARGMVEALDERSDVFMLGAILCELLTGKPPYQGAGVAEVIGLAAIPDLRQAHQRLARCGADRELVELARACLEPEAEARPRSAGAVAASVTYYFKAAEQRARQARERAAALRRGLRIGAILLVVVGAALAVSLWAWRQADEAAVRAAAAAEKESIARTAAETNLANFNRLSHVVRLRRARAAERTFHPAWPDKAAAMRRWLDRDAADLLAAANDLRTTIERLQAVPSEMAVDADRFLLTTLLKLVEEIGAFEAKDVPEVNRAHRWATQVEELTITRYGEAWKDARLAIRQADGKTASKRYAGVPVELSPQLGLVPIGMNPQTGLWEFYHLRSAWDGEGEPSAIAIPRHSADGSLKADRRGIVFVLVPGGAAGMGAMPGRVGEPHRDPMAQANERPVRRVELAPFFIARHELTQGQWARLSGGEFPSWYNIGATFNGIPGKIGDDHPVEQVSWSQCTELLDRHGLLMPTEAQWEYACRADTTTPWFTGAVAVSLFGFANVLDRTGNRIPPRWPNPEAFDDGVKGPAKVGSYRANPFGLYDVHGNVAEWCRDGFGEYNLSPRPGDGLREPASDSGLRAHRGGSYHGRALTARSSHRGRDAVNKTGVNLGVRPSRPLMP